MRKPDYVPLRVDALADAMGLEKREARKLKRTINTLLEEGAVAKVKTDRYCLPGDADLVSGTIYFRQSGAATLVPDSAPEKSPAEVLSIRAEDTGIALHGDKVLARYKFNERGYGYHNRGKNQSKQVEPRFARVIRVLNRARETFSGTLQQSRHFWHVIMDDPRIVQDFLVPDPARTEVFPPPKEGDKVLVRLVEWRQRHLNPQGEILEVLGKTHTPGAEFKALLHKYNLSPEFPENVIQETRDVPEKVQPKDIRKRLDCRELFTFTIDPDDAKDFDDALSIEDLENGETRVGIHIADVTAYVRPGTVLDKEAQKRGNSTYLVGCVIPMLPHALSNGICSLVEDEDRLTKSVFLTFTRNGKIRESEFANTVIRSNKRLTYHQAVAFLKKDDFEAIRATPLPPAHQTGSTGRNLQEVSNKEMARLQQAIRTLWDFASKYRQQRLRSGSLDIDMPESKIYVDREGYADRIEVVHYDESHQLIEEFMLLANETVAKHLSEANIPYISRVHDEPDPDKLVDLRETLLLHGIEVGDLTNRKEVRKLMDILRTHPQGHTLKVAFLRSLKQACYRAEANGHYGLAKRFYAHFTSPIRRYADLIDHRIFNFYLTKTNNSTADARKAKVYKKGELDSLAQHISVTEQNSTEAERESVKIKLLEYFERELQKEERTAFEAVVLDTVNHGMFVELKESSAYGLVHISTLRDDLYRLNPEGNALIGRRQKRRYNQGQTVKVQVERVDRYKRQIDFSLASDEDAQAPSQSFPKRPSQNKPKKKQQTGKDGGRRAKQKQAQGKKDSQAPGSRKRKGHRRNRKQG